MNIINQKIWPDVWSLHQRHHASVPSGEEVGYRCGRHQLCFVHEHAGESSPVRWSLFAETEIDDISIRFLSVAESNRVLEGSLASTLCAHTRNRRLFSSSEYYCCSLVCGRVDLIYRQHECIMFTSLPYVLAFEVDWAYEYAMHAWVNHSTVLNSSIYDVVLSKTISSLNLVSFITSVRSRESEDPFANV